MFDAGQSGFVGGISAKKNVSITLVSKATANGYQAHLVPQGIFTKEGEGRSVQYRLILA